MQIDNCAPAIWCLHAVDVIQNQSDCRRSFPNFLFELKVIFGTQSDHDRIIAASNQDSIVDHWAHHLVLFCFKSLRHIAKVYLIDQGLIRYENFVWIVKFFLLLPLFKHSFDLNIPWLCLFLLNSANFPLKHRLVIQTQSQHSLVILRQKESLDRRSMSRQVHSDVLLDRLCVSPKIYITVVVTG